MCTSLRLNRVSSLNFKLRRDRGGASLLIFQKIVVISQQQMRLG